MFTEQDLIYKNQKTIDFLKESGVSIIALPENDSVWIKYKVIEIAKVKIVIWGEITNGYKDYKFLCSIRDTWTGILQNKTQIDENIRRYSPITSTAISNYMEKSINNIMLC